MLCQHCFTANMQPPLITHPAYMICPNCMAMELTYIPLGHVSGYQADFHNREYVLNADGDIQPQIIGVFGGKNP